jgi:formamidopyrimidine-DNA glycosylase
MPELPEAETVVGQLRARLPGATCVDYWIGRDDIIREGLSTFPWYRGARLSSIQRMGKCVVLAFEQEHETRFLVFELGMTGLLFFSLLDTSYQKHTHVSLSLNGTVPNLFYWNPRRFGRVYALTQEGLDQFVSRRFGVDPLTVSWETFHTLVKKRRGRLKPLLMYQQAIAGIGNIYANEILFRSGLHPYRIASSLRTATIRRLYDVMQQVLHEAILDGGSSVRDFIAPDGTKGTYRKWHQIYNKAGQPCPQCGTIIRRLKGERSSFICPSCQRP